MVTYLRSSINFFFIIGGMLVASVMHSRTVFLGQTGMWGMNSWHWVFIGFTILGALWLWHSSMQRWPIMVAVSVAMLDVAWHMINPITTAYMHLVNPGFLALNMTAILILWQMGRFIRHRESHHTHLSAIVLIIPTIIAWNIFVSHSPLTAVYAEIYGGGEALIGQGSSSLFLFVAIWSGVWIWMRQKSIPFGSFTIISVLLAFSQVAIKGEWRFVVIIVGAALIAELSHRRWPTHWHLNSVLWTIGFGGGYFFVLHYTTSIAWETSIWTGILTIMIIISYALARISNPYHTLTGAN